MPDQREASAGEEIRNVDIYDHSLSDVQTRVIRDRFSAPKTGRGRVTRNVFEDMLKDASLQSHKP
jgi:hypothetical protein